MIPSLYIHIPFCTAKCFYCDFFSLGASSLSKDLYVDSLLKEISYYKNVYDVESWKTIYVGGGTPSTLSSGQLRQLLSSCKTDGEFTVEMNPESITEEKLWVLMDCGVNRLSVGIQSMTQKALDAVGRKCSAEKASAALETISSTWKGQLNLDLIAGLPEQDEGEFIASAEKVISCNPDHISLYTLTVEEGTPLYEKTENGEISFDPDNADRQWLLGRDLLEKNGFMQYEVSNFAKDGAFSRHNMTYWNQEDYVGAGAGATGTIYGNEKIRWTNTDDIPQYMDFWQKKNSGEMQGLDAVRETEILDDKTLEFEFLMLGLRTLKGIDSHDYRKRFHHVGPWHGNLENRLSQVVSEPDFKDFFTVREHSGGTNYALTKNGILFLNRILLNLI